MLGPCIQARNATRHERIEEGRGHLRALSTRPLPAYRELYGSVSRASAVRILKHSCSVSSRLIGCQLRVRVGTPQLNRAHGGVLAALADAAAGYTLMARTGVSLSTVDLRLDFHQGASPGDLRIKGTVVHQGRKLACVDVQIFDASGQLVASARSTLYTPTVESA